LDRDSFAESVEVFFAGLSADFDKVSLLDVGGGPGEFVGEFAVVGYEEESLAKVVKAADGV
jgi:hypothetical protein